MTINITKSTGWNGEDIDLTEEYIIVRSLMGLTGELTDFANSIYCWCFENGIDADFVSHKKEILNGEYYNMSLWYIKDDGQRVLFALKWC